MFERDLLSEDLKLDKMEGKRIYREDYFYLEEERK